jgi:hypothetical protein
MTDVTPQPNSSLDRIINGLKAIERIADKNSSTILYVTGMAILAVTYAARFAPAGIRHMEYNEFIFSCVFAGLFFLGAASLRLHIHKLTLDRAAKKDSELSHALNAAATAASRQVEQTGNSAG